MTTFAPADGTVLSYRLVGQGTPLVCLAGGPGLSSDTLGDLGGLPGRHQLVLLDQRGTGASATPTDLETLRADRLPDDVEALREHLALDRLDLLGHSAGANVAILYAAAHPGRVRRLVLVTPGSHALGVETTEQEFLLAARRRAAESWYAEAYGAALALVGGDGSDQAMDAFAPLNYGRFDAAAAAHAAARAHRTAPVAAERFFPSAGFDVQAVRAGIRRLAAPVLVYGGDVDVMPTVERVNELAALFPHGVVTIQSDAGHHPWLDDPDFFIDAVSAFLSEA